MLVHIQELADGFFFGLQQAWGHTGFKTREHDLQHPHVAVPILEYSGNSYATWWVSGNPMLQGFAGCLEEPRRILPCLKMLLASILGFLFHFPLKQWDVSHS